MGDTSTARWHHSILHDTGTAFCMGTTKETLYRCSCVCCTDGCVLCRCVTADVCRHCSAMQHRPPGLHLPHLHTVALLNKDLAQALSKGRCSSTLASSLIKLSLTSLMTLVSFCLDYLITVIEDRGDHMMVIMSVTMSVIMTRG